MVIQLPDFRIHRLTQEKKMFVHSPSASNNNTCPLTYGSKQNTAELLLSNDSSQYSVPHNMILSEHNYCYDGITPTSTNESEKDFSLYVVYKLAQSLQNNISSNMSNFNFIVREKIQNLSSNAKKYEQQIRSLHTVICQSCDKILFPEQVRRLCMPQEMPCQTSQLQTGTFCSKCSNSVIQGKTSSTSIGNKLFAGIVPPCLSQLTYAECRMISQIQSYMTIIILPGGQYAEKGLAIHFPLDLNAYFEQLLINKDEHFLVIAQNTNQQAQAVSLANLVSFDKVKAGISWLKTNNPLYKDFPDFVADPIYDKIGNVKSDNATIVEQVTDILASDLQTSVIPVNYTIPDVEISDVLTKSKHISIPILFNSPSWISQVPGGEELAFPWLFPLGCGGLTEERPIRLSVPDYFNCRLYNRDSRWRKSITYLMYAVNHMEQSRLSNEIEIQMRLKSLGKASSQITAGDLYHPGTHPEIKANTFMFMKNIRGTVAYWADILHNLLSTVKTLRPPTLFVTLSSDDCNWPKLKMLLHGVSYTEALQMPSCTSAMRKDPLLTLVFFEGRWKAFLKFILKSKDSPVGQILDFFARIEYQNRGSPHIHLFLWVMQAPSLERSTASEILQYIDKVISTTIPNENDDQVLNYLVGHLQTHHHTSRCQRHKTCRLDFHAL